MDSEAPPMYQTNLEQNEIRTSIATVLTIIIIELTILVFWQLIDSNSIVIVLL